jgi:hypothetical protein
MSYELVLRKHDDGSVELVGEALERIRISRELLDSADSVMVKLNDRGDVMFSLSNAVLWYRRLGLVDGDERVAEYERVA